MTTLVTGSSGLIGSALIEALTRRGERVVRLARPGTSVPGSGPGAAHAAVSVDWDPERGTIDRPGLEATGPFDAVVHLAGAGVADRRWNPARKEQILTSRTASTSLLVSTLGELEARPPVLVSASAIGIYGHRGSEELTEVSGRGGGFLADVAAAWEAAAEPAVAAGVRVVNLRTGLVLSTTGGVLAKQLPLFKLGVGGRLGPGTQYQSWISIDDEVAVIEAAIADQSLAGPVNAVAPHPVTNAQFTAALGGALHRPTLATVPAAALRLALGKEMADQTVLASQQVLPAVLPTAGVGRGNMGGSGCVRIFGG
jgi:uncharacterized protein (TIGR01777 family)